MKRKVFLVLIVSSTGACAGTSSVSEDTEGGESSETGDAPQLDRIEIPVVPNADVAMVGLLEPDRSGAFGSRTGWTFAFGEPYAQVLTSPMSGTAFSYCGSGAYEVVDVTIEGDAVRADSVDGELIVSLVEPGTATLRAEGHVDFDPGCDVAADTALRFIVDIEVVEVATSRIVPACNDASAPIATSAGPSARTPFWYRVELLDPNGLPIVVDNATRENQAGVVLEGVFSDAEGEPESLERWRSGPRPGSVSITPEGGEPLEVRVIGPEQVESVELDWQFPGAGAGPWSAEDGETYESWARTGRRLVPQLLAVNTELGPLCSSPDPAWFRLESTTPDCEIVPIDDAPPFLLHEDGTGQAARPLRDGRCALRLHADELPASAGLPAGIEVTLGNVEQMIEL